MFGELSIYVCMVVTSHIWFLVEINTIISHIYFDRWQTQHRFIKMDWWINAVQQPLYLIEFIFVLFCFLFLVSFPANKNCCLKSITYNKWYLTCMYERSACNWALIKLMFVCLFSSIFVCFKYRFFYSDCLENIVCELQKCGFLWK